MDRIKLSVLLISIVFLASACDNTPVQFKNNKRMMVGICFFNVGYPDGWIVENTDESTMHICNNKKVDTCQRIEFWIKNTTNHHQKIDKRTLGYKKIKKDNISYEFAINEYFWSKDRYRSRTYGIINKLGITLYELEFEYLPNQDDFPDELKDFFLGIVIE